MSFFFIETRAGFCLGSATFLLKAKKSPFVLFFSLAGRLWRPGAVRSYESGINAARVRAHAPGWAERHVACGAPLTSVCTDCIYRERAYTHTHTHLDAPTHANSCLCISKSPVIFSLPQPAVGSQDIFAVILSIAAAWQVRRTRWLRSHDSGLQELLRCAYCY